MLVRDFDIDDVAPIVEILELNGQYAHPDVEGPEAMIRVKECDAAVFLVCELEGQIVGWPCQGCLRRFTSYDSSPFRPPGTSKEGHWNCFGRTDSQAI